MNEILIKKSLKDIILNSLFSIDEVISVTIVGSFTDRSGLASISDIDTIVIVKRLEENYLKGV